MRDSVLVHWKRKGEKGDRRKKGMMSELLVLVKGRRKGKERQKGRMSRVLVVARERKKKGGNRGRTRRKKDRCENWSKNERKEKKKRGRRGEREERKGVN